MCSSDLRAFVTVDVTPKEADPTAEVCAAIERAAIDDAIVRVAVKLSYEQSSQFRQMEARKLLERAHFVGGFRVVLPDEVATRLPPGVQPDAASPIESLETYLKLKNIDDARRTRLLSAAEDLMHELGA